MATPATYQPLNVWHAFETCVRIYIGNIPALLLAAAVAVVPSNALYLILQSATIPASLTDTFGRPFANIGARPKDIPSEDLAAFVIATTLGSIVLFVAFALATAACCVIVAESWYGRKPTWSSAWREVGARFPSLLWLTFVWGLLLAVGLLLCLLPGIWLGVAWCVALPALMFEGSRGTTALERSFRLTRGRWWPTFGGLVLVLGAASLASGAFTFPAFFIGFWVEDFFISSTIAGTLNMLGTILTVPVYGAIMTVFFFDLRARQQLATSPPPYNPSPPAPPE